MASSFAKKSVIATVSLLAGVCIGCGSLATALAIGQHLQSEYAQTVTVISSPPIYTSAGIGLTRWEWEQRYGPALSTDAGHSKFRQGTLVMREPGEDSKLTWVQRMYHNPDSVNLDQARADIRAMSPADALPVDAHISENVVTERYVSEMLGQRLPRTTWGSSQPGTFIVVYYLEDDRIGGFVITTDPAYPQPIAE